MPRILVTLEGLKNDIQQIEKYPQSPATKGRRRGLCVYFWVDRLRRELPGW
jgi:hypothetical protein